jgi:DNA/RNA-binding domain of Phe-tRNA-synthetase-like protein
VKLDIAELLPAFPDFRVALLVVRDLSIPPSGSPPIARILGETETALAAELVGATLAELPEIRCWREAYRAFGVKKTSYRSSVERLLRNLQRGEGLPRVNGLVDLYNAVSARRRMPVGADDLDRVAPPLAFRHARPGDSFIALGDPAAQPDPPKPGEVVYADAGKVLCRRWNWYQDARSAIRSETRSAVLTIQALEPASAARLESSAAELAHLLATHCGARAAWAIADRKRPTIALPEAAAAELPAVHP